MYRDQTFGTKTSEVAPGTSKADIDGPSLKQYRDYMGRFNPDVSYNRFDEDEFLSKMRILDHSNCTYAGLLFLGKRESIEKHFPDFRIDLLEIPGTSISNATSNYTFRLDEYENLWDYYFECFKRLKPQVDVEFKLTDQGFGQELSPGLKTIRETLVNMLMHADYFSPAHSRIRIFTDHIEFFNPGGLPKPLEELKAKDLSLPRNPLISKMFRMVRLAENAGFGFDKIESNWQKYNQSAPEYIIDYDSVILKLFTKDKISTTVGSDLFHEVSEQIRNNILDQSVTPSGIQKMLRDNYGVITGQLRGNYGVKIEDIQELKGERALWILALILIVPHITKQQLAELLEASVSTIEKTMRSLRNEQIINRLGSAKTGTWVLNTDKKKE